VLSTVTTLVFHFLLQNVNHVLHAKKMKTGKRSSKQKAAGVSRLPGVGKHGYGRRRWWKVAVTAAAFSFLLSCLLCFSSQPPLCFFRCLLFFSSVSSGPSAAVRWCAVAVERKHGGSCGCSSSPVFFFLPLSLPVLPCFFDGFPFSFKRIVPSLGLPPFSFLSSSF